jgi:hypothetical protein
MGYRTQSPISIFSIKAHLRLVYLNIVLSAENAIVLVLCYWNNHFIYFIVPYLDMYSPNPMISQIAIILSNTYPNKHIIKSNIAIVAEVNIGPKLP